LEDNPDHKRMERKQRSRKAIEQLILKGKIKGKRPRGKRRLGIETYQGRPPIRGGVGAKCSQQMLIQQIYMGKN
jgi:hypothetical protein